MAVEFTARPAFFSWSRLKVPALLLLIAVNVGLIGGNAVLDLWQTLGPGTHFSGTIAGHEQIISTGEDAQQHNLLTVASDRGQLQFDVFDKTYADTHAGQQVTGELDSRKLFGHDEGLRSLSADGHQVYTSQSLPRAAGQALILVVVLAMGGLAARLVLKHAARRSPSRVTATPQGVEVR